MNAAGSEITTYCANDNCKIERKKTNYNFTKAFPYNDEHTEERMNVAKSQQRQKNICSEIESKRRKKNKRNGHTFQKKPK